MKVGIFFGCFIPLHCGHESLIRKALEENDHLILGLCGYDGDRGDGYIPFKDRISLMTEIYGGRDDITLSIVDDKKIGLTGTFSVDAWRTWCKELFGNSGYNPCDPSVEYTWYSGDESYLEKICQLYPLHRFVHIPRNIIPLSGTIIRRNSTYHQNDMHLLFQDYLRRNGIITGYAHK